VPELSDHLDKMAEKVTVFIGNLKILGHMHRHPDVRFSDEWNREHRDFVPLTDCTIADRSTGKTVDDVRFVMVCRDHVDLIYPEAGGGKRIVREEPEAENEKPEPEPEQGVLRKRLRRIRPT